MRRLLLLAASVAALGVATFGSARTDPGAPQAQPRTTDEQRRGGGASEGPRAGPGRQAEPQGPKAQPRQSTERDRDRDREQAPARRTAPPPRVVPPQYHVVPRVYFFPPVNRVRGFYYHPYFGFYFGPYYGPYYPHPGPLFGPAGFGASAVRTRVRPVETEIYVNGYFAGVADDFDGVFQRLYLPAGQHRIEFHLHGYRTFEQRIYVGPGDTREIAHQMVRVAPGEVSREPMPQTLSGELATAVPGPAGDRPASPYGILAIRVQPVDALILIDGETWLGTEAQTDLTVHVPAGWHTLEVRKDGYRNFQTKIELPEGATTRLSVTLER
jgi:hypothetical protein